VGLAVAGVAAQRGAGPRIPPTGTIEKVRGNLYKIAGAGGNTTVFITADGVVLVDTKLANNGDAILKQVQTVTDKPVSMIINTHTHPDHNGSNDYFKAARPTVEVVTHENTGKWVAANKQANPAMKPDKTFADKLTLGGGKDQIDLYYFGPAHTNGDAFVVFPALRVLQTGDLFAWKDAPRIDRANGGSGVQYPQTLAKAVAALNHPNIAAIYGLERSGPTTALVMELVEGPTLADRIAQGAIPIDEALPIAKQIAEALEAAHEQAAGVVGGVGRRPAHRREPALRAPGGGAPEQRVRGLGVGLDVEEAEEADLVGVDFVVEGVGDGGDAPGLLRLGQHHGDDHGIRRDGEEGAFDKGHDGQGRHGPGTCREGNDPVVKTPQHCGMTLPPAMALPLSGEAAAGKSPACAAAGNGVAPGKRVAMIRRLSGPSAARFAAPGPLWRNW